MEQNGEGNLQQKNNNFIASRQMAAANNNESNYSQSQQQQTQQPYNQQQFYNLQRSNDNSTSGGISYHPVQGNKPPQQYPQQSIIHQQHYFPQSNQPNQATQYSPYPQHQQQFHTYRPGNEGTEAVETSARQYFPHRGRAGIASSHTSATSLSGHGFNDKNMPQHPAYQIPHVPSPVTKQQHADPKPNLFGANSKRGRVDGQVGSSEWNARQQYIAKPLQYSQSHSFTSVYGSGSATPEAVSVPLHQTAQPMVPQQHNQLPQNHHLTGMVHPHHYNYGRDYTVPAAQGNRNHSPTQQALSNFSTIPSKTQIPGQWDASMAAKSQLEGGFSIPEIGEPFKGSTFSTPLPSQQLESLEQLQQGSFSQQYSTENPVLGSSQNRKTTLTGKTSSDSKGKRSRIPSKKKAATMDSDKSLPQNAASDGNMLATTTPGICASKSSRKKSTSKGTNRRKTLPNSKTTKNEEQHQETLNAGDELSVSSRRSTMTAESILVPDRKKRKLEEEMKTGVPANRPVKKLPPKPGAQNSASKKKRKVLKEEQPPEPLPEPQEEEEEEAEDAILPEIPLEILEMVNYHTRIHHHTNPLLTTPPFPGLITQWPSGNSTQKGGGAATAILARMTPIQYYQQLYRQFCSEDESQAQSSSHLIQNAQFSEAPHASELWAICQIYFATQSDVFPMRYYANLLGFDFISPEQQQHPWQPRIDDDAKNKIHNDEFGVEGRNTTQENKTDREFCDSNLDNKIGRQNSKQTTNIPQSIKTEDKPKDPKLKVPSVNIFKDIKGAVKNLMQEQYLLKLLHPLDQDPFLQIPPLGLMPPNLSKLVHKLDPIFITLLKYFQGYSEECFRKGASMSSKQAPRIVSADCVSMAQELCLINDFTFRFATMTDITDVQLLFVSSSNDNKKYLLRPQYKVLSSEADCYAILRSATDFILLAHDKKTNEVKGGIHYCFHWYRQQNLCSSSGQPLSELVLYINHLVLNGDLYSVGTVVPVMLTCLALEHARANGIAYGTAMSEGDDCAKLLRKYFRADVAGGWYIHKDNMTTVPLVLDLLKCSFRYTWLLFKQPICGKTLSALRSSDKFEDRIILRLPSRESATVTLALGFGDIAAASPVVGALVPSFSTRSDRHASDEDNGPPTSSSVKPILRDKKVNIQVQIGKDDPQHDQDHQDEITKQALGRIKLYRPKEPAENDSNLIEMSVAPVGTVDNLFVPGWDVLRVVTSPKKVLSTPCDDLRDSLIEKQRELQILEQDIIQPKLKKLLEDVMKERLLFESNRQKRRKRQSLGPNDAFDDEEDRATKEYETLMIRKKEEALAWQQQLEQDMDAVCDICNDGEVTQKNQILFCETCNVAVHQGCYGIDSIPAGDYFCHACRFFGRDKDSKDKMSRGPLPIVCELCPRKGGAFVRTKTPAVIDKNSKSNPKNDSKDNVEIPRDQAKWVHVVCAKWQGLDYVDKEKRDCIVPVQEIKNYFRVLEISCDICKGMRGAYNQCNHENCDKYLHVSCARSLGTCKVYHGETYDGQLEDQTLAWKLMCPQHSSVAPEEIPEKAVPQEKLIELSKNLPPDPLPPPEKEKPKKKFNKMSREEREKWLADPEYEENFNKQIIVRREGAFCAVCNVREESSGKPTNNSSGDDSKVDELDEIGLLRCVECNLMVHKECYITQKDLVPQGGNYKRERTFLCDACAYVQQKTKEEPAAAADSPTAEESAEKDRKEESPDKKSLVKIDVPQCNLCNQPGGPLRKAFATPISMTRWKKDPKAYVRSMFGRQIWAHSSCGIWHPLVDMAQRDGEDQFDCTMIIMSNGMGHVNSSHVCNLCGRHDKIKMACSTIGCRVHSDSKTKPPPYRFHITCARQAGLQVSDKTINGETHFLVHCFFHMSCEYVFRARLEDLLEIEKNRSGRKLQQQTKAMSMSHASRLHHFSVTVLQQLSWAWKWADWWVAYGDNWEPLLEPDQREDEMTKEELRIIDSTPESRCKDARRCRLAALGAALRNRNYDDLDEEDGKKALDRALRAVLNTPSLVGPLEAPEIDFFADWLGRAYRSKDPLLGFGEKDQIVVAKDGILTHHIADRSPKYELGSRPLPGLHELAEGEFFEPLVDEVDDFLKTPISEIEQSPPVSANSKKKPSQLFVKKRKRTSDEMSITTPDSVQPRRTSRRKVNSNVSEEHNANNKSKDGISRVPLPDEKKEVVVKVKTENEIVSCTDDEESNPSRQTKTKSKNGINPSSLPPIPTRSSRRSSKTDDSSVFDPSLSDTNGINDDEEDQEEEYEVEQFSSTSRSRSRRGSRLASETKHKKIASLDKPPSANKKPHEEYDDAAASSNNGSLGTFRIPRKNKAR